MKGYLTRNIRTRFLRKELRNLMNNQDYSRKMNDNSEDKILSMTSGFKKIEDYTSYKTQRTQYYNMQGSKEKPGHS